MATLLAGNSASFTLGTLQSLNISTGGTGSLSFTSSSEIAQPSFTASVANGDFGPYNVSMAVVMTMTAGSADYTVVGGADVTAVVDPLTGGIAALKGPNGKNQQFAGAFDPTIPILILGGDHPYDQWMGTSDSGLAKMYADYGITPYVAINTASGWGKAPGAANQLTWAQVKALSDAGRVEFLSHAHRHIQQWGRIDTGIRIVYSGASATATVGITGTPKTLTLTAGGGSEDQAFDLTNAAYDTLAELVAAITANASGKWTATLAPELVGTENSLSMLALVTARSVKAGGAAGYFSCGSGIVISYSGAAYQSAVVQVTANVLNIYLDGVLKSAINLASAANDTLFELIGVINAIGITGLRAAVCYDTLDQGTFSYTQGDEASIGLSTTLMMDITNNGGLALNGSYIGDGARLNAGLPFSYLVTRQMQAAKDTAAANGVTLKNFAQSGGGLAQWHLMGQNQYKSYRMNMAETSRYPSAQWSAIGPDYIRSHYDFSLGANTAASGIAVLDAMTDSPGCMVDLLCHALTPAEPAGVNGYTYAATDSAGPVAEAVWLAVLAHAETLVDAGSLITMTPEEARKVRKFCGTPQNMVFNPFFRNDGTAVLNSSSSFTVPGWSLATNVARVTACTITTDGSHTSVGKFNFTLDAATNTNLITQALLLEPGNTYRIGSRINFSAYTSGTGVRLTLAPRQGRLDQQLIDDTSPTWSSAWAITDNDLSMLVSIPDHKAQPPMVRGLVAGPFDTTTLTALSINIDAIGAVAVTLTSGAAITASVIAADINAAIAATGAYAAKQEFWTAASAVGGKVVVKSPYAGEEFWNRLTISGNACATVFGAASCMAVPVYSDMMHLALPMDFAVQSQVIGSFSVMQPYCRKVNLAY